MSLFRCGACGSPNVVKDSQTGGLKYNFAKGAIGTIALGVGGAVAGLSNSVVDVYVCPDCGARLSSPMEETLKNAIDLATLDLNARENLQIWGVPISWEFIAEKYKNIEKGPADKRAQERAMEKKRGRERYQEVMEFGAKADEEFLSSNIDDLQKLWEIENSKNAKAKADYEAVLLQQVEEAYEQEKKDIAKKKAQKLDELPRQIETLQTDIANLNKELSSLGIFKISEKNRIKSEILNKQETITSSTSELENLDEDTESLLYDAKCEYEKKKAAARSEAFRKYPITSSPQQKLKRIEFVNSIKARAYAYFMGTAEAMQYIFYLLEQTGEPLYMMDGKFIEADGSELFFEGGQVYQKIKMWFRQATKENLIVTEIVGKEYSPECFYIYNLA